MGIFCFELGSCGNAQKGQRKKRISSQSETRSDNYGRYKEYTYG